MGKKKVPRTKSSNVMKASTALSQDPRLQDLVGLHSKPRVSLIGFPCDEGVRINGGRLGARLAPAQIRRIWGRLTPDARAEPGFSALLRATKDLREVSWKGGVEEAQAALAEEVAADLKAGIVPIVLGGGHETTLGHFLGYVRAERPVSILNVDAHPDVRERKNGLPHSGSSFREALLHSSRSCKGYSVLGLQPQSCAAEHLEFLKANKCRYVFAEDLSESLVEKTFKGLKSDTLLSIDLDVVDQAYAPGVSAPCVGGITPSSLFALCYRAGRCKSICSLDLVEVNPIFDRDDATARLAALACWHFLRGMCER